MGLGEDLEWLERSLRQLQIEWEKFFGGVEKKPPNELKDRLEAVIRRYAYTEVRNNTERFRYQGLVSRYNTFNELWNKRLRAREEGRIPGLHVPRPLAALVGDTSVPPPPPEEPRPRPRGEVRVQEPERDVEAMKALFDQFLAKRKETGEMGTVKFEAFKKVVSQQAARILSEKGATAVDFRLETKDGKVSLKAKVVR